MNETSEKLAAHAMVGLLQRNWGDIKATTLFNVKVNKSVGDPLSYVQENILPRCFLYPPYVVGGTQFSRQQRYKEMLQKKFDEEEFFPQYLAHLYERAMEKGGIRFIFASAPACVTYGGILIEFLMDNTHAISTIHDYLYPKQAIEQA